MHAKQLKEYIIQPVLQAMSMHSEAAVQLLLMTAAHESHMGHYLVQKGGGPALGLYQIEPATAADVVQRYLTERRPDLQDNFEAAFQLVNSSVIDWENVDLGKIGLKLISDLRFSTAVARMRYWMVPESLPGASDAYGLAQYYKQHYNTVLGKAEVESVIADYHHLVLAFD